jgi:hypothetical protein
MTHTVDTFEGVVKNGKIQLPLDVHLPEDATVYIVVPKLESPPFRIRTPRLVHPEQAADFKMTVVKEDDNGDV